MPSWKGTVDDILSVLELESTEDDNAPDTVVIIPPNEYQDTDEDSDLSDDELTAAAEHLPARILRAECEAYNRQTFGEDESVSGQSSHSSFLNMATCKPSMKVASSSNLQVCPRTSGKRKAPAPETATENEAAKKSKIGSNLGQPTTSKTIEVPHCKPSTSFAGDSDMTVSIQKPVKRKVPVRKAALENNAAKKRETSTEGKAVTKSKATVKNRAKNKNKTKVKRRAPLRRRGSKSKKKSKAVKKIWKHGAKKFHPLPTSDTPDGEDGLRLEGPVESPLEAFRLFFQPSLVNLLTEQTNLYASQHGKMDLKVTPEEMNCFIGILLLSGYNVLPNRRLYWSKDEDVTVPLVGEVMSRNRFDELMRYLHVADNSKNDGSDNMYKVRPLTDSLNGACKKVFAPPKRGSFDESIWPYYGRHPSKQVIRGKPIRFGFKFWVLASPNGFLHHSEPYCGKSTDLEETEFGQGGSVVLGLIKKANVEPGSKTYFDNLFTSSGLLDKLSEMQIGGTGTLRENRLTHNLKFCLEAKEHLKKSERGLFSTASKSNQLAVRWNDNAVVTVLTNCDKLTPLGKVNRYSRVQRKKIPVWIPNPVLTYNKNMGGVDLNDQFLATYRTSIRSKKWWWSYFAWTLDQSCVQAWLVYRTLGNKIPLLNFRRQLTLEILRGFKRGMTPVKKSSKVVDDALDTVRKDGRDHLIIKWHVTHLRCKECSGRTRFRCKKCNVTLHPECFEAFHS